jgi:hypothetical protein
LAAMAASRKTESFMVVGLFPISRQEKSEYRSAAPLTDIMMMPILDSRVGTLL